MVSSTWFSAESNLEKNKKQNLRDCWKSWQWVSFLSSYLLTWSLKTSSCCFSGAEIISSTSVNCSGSAPLACRDARMASIRCDFSKRRLQNQSSYQPSYQSQWDEDLNYQTEIFKLQPTCFLWSRKDVARWGWQRSAEETWLHNKLKKHLPWQQKQILQAFCGSTFCFSLSWCLNILYNVMEDSSKKKRTL